MTCKYSTSRARTCSNSFRPSSLLLPLPDALFGQGGDEVDVRFIDDGSSRIDMQPGKTIFLSQTDLQYRQVSLQPRLLIKNTSDPTFLDSRGGSCAQIKSGGIDITRLSSGGIQIGADRSR